VLVALFKGVLYSSTQPALWSSLLNVRGGVADYVAVLGLVLQVDEAEGYAFLRSRPGTGEDDAPRLVARRALSFPVSLLLALLRKRLAEFDAISAETRLVLRRDQIFDLVRVFLPDSSNEARLLASVDTSISKIVDLGFLRPMRGSENLYEVRRVLKAFVDGQWLADFDARLGAYRESLAEEVR
jgi:hypothetical protein